MAREYEDSVKDQTISNGPASFTLAGIAPNGYRTPVAAHTNGVTITLRIESADNSEWQVADYTLNTSTGVATYASLHESHTGSQVTFSAGTKAVTEVMPAASLRKPDYTTSSSLASAGTLNLDSATGGRVHVTGTTTITAVTLTHGPRTVIFDGVLTLTHHATNNNLPGGANIATVAGDRAVYESDGTIVYCVGYFRARGLPTRVGSTTSSATPTINTDVTDIYRLTAQAVDITSFTTNLTGTPGHGDVLVVEITGTAARAIAWGASFEASTVPLPTTTSGTSMLQVSFMWNSGTSKWRCVGSC